MKTMKKLASLALALILALALAVPAMAAEQGVVNNTTPHTYDAYQIFNGTQATDDAALGNIEWGTGIKTETIDKRAGLLEALKGDSRFVQGEGEDASNIFATAVTAADVAKILSENPGCAEAFANVVAQHLTGTVTKTIAAEKTVELPAGYYLLVDTTAVGENDARNSALLQVTNKGNVDIAKKYSVPEVDKEIKGTVDGVEIDEGEAGDFNIGDNVPFTLTGTLPSNYADYETYKYVFHDTLSAGLDYNDDAKVYVVNGESKVEVTGSFAITEENGVLTISCTDLKDITTATLDAASKIVVEYTATLDSDAEIGQPGNPNKVYLEYSNNPNQTGDGEPTTSNTPEDEVLVFTYKLDVTKIDGENNTITLAGAEFKLRNEADKWATVDTDGRITDWVDAEADGSPLTSGADGLFKVIGLDAGTYYLKETKAPSGYNLLTGEITIVITATIDDTDKSESLDVLTIDVTSNGKTASANGDLATGTVNASVENNKGATLPETGGIGTTIFYAVGGVLVVAAIVLLVTKKRMNREG